MSDELVPPVDQEAVPESPGDQSLFSESQERLQEPPEVIAERELPAEERALRDAKRKRIRLMIAVILVLVVGLWALIALQPAKEKKTIARPTPTPSPMPRYTETEKEVQRVRELFEAADPREEPFSPPPVDMDVEF